jgi:hypothetical protein
LRATVILPPSALDTLGTLRCTNFDSKENLSGPLGQSLILALCVRHACSTPQHRVSDAV